MSDAGQDRNEQLQQIIRKELERLLTSISVKSVTVEGYEGAYGDPMLRVIVVYEPSDAIPEITGLVRQLRPVLADHGETRFPVMSFVAAEEAEEYFAPA